MEENMLPKEELPDCPVAITVGLIGNKWKLLIIRDLLTGTKRFGQLRKSVTGISQKVLTDNLRALEQDGLLTRTVYAEVPPRVEYTLTKIGDSLLPIMDSMAAWAENYKKQIS
jgi:DNA-binding HxlR family transcriptional regulator